MGEHIFSRTGPIIDPMNLRSHQGLLHLNFLYPKKSLTFNLNLLQWQKNGINWMMIVRKVYMQKNPKRRKIISLYTKKDLNCAIGKVPLPTFDGSSQSFANTWVQKLDVYF